MVKLNETELGIAEGRAKRFSDYVYERVHSITNLPAYEETFTDYFKSLKLNKKVHNYLNKLGVISILYAFGALGYGFSSLNSINNNNPISTARVEKAKLTTIIAHSSSLFNAGIDTTQINPRLRDEIKTLDSEIEELMQTDAGREIRELNDLFTNPLYASYGGFGLMGLSAIRKKLYKPYIKFRTKRKLAQLTSKQLVEGADLEIPSNFE